LSALRADDPFGMGVTGIEPVTSRV
jgi:hypothetical protein